ncbi:nuclear speckle splicing regulatory protein 1 [Drosophila ficusphila]|uniref:nuclear speckle splicing regulatory protein 1 n=1 Tax=Drosophila ficusphila TaxID=30025 RepID=UPI0007E6BB96|nr:nuclear speckle splicing regulatory protein 1 [Drosophila ficusphila]
MSKQYGLIIPGQQKKVPVKPPVKPSIFDESSASESDDDRNAPQNLKSKTGVSSGPSLMERRVARKQQEKALAEDPTIFQYDELYDDMDNKREEAKQTKSQEPRKPKYIGRLMEHAERRKLEKELRIERQVQKDREAEGEMYKDKDTYVTAAYRKKLESIRQMQEQEQRDEYLEAIGDVTKQKDLGGFYRHLYEQKLGNADEDVVKPKTAPSTEEVAYKPIKAEAAKHRSYRRRRSSEEEAEAKAKSGQDSETKTSTDQTESKPAQAHLANNIDADSDFSIDDSSDEEEEKKKDQEQDKSKDKLHSQGKKKEKDKPQESSNETEPKEPAQANKSPGKKEVSDSELEEKDLPVPIVTKPPVDRTLIWRKRTVGEVFDAALARYQERKRARQG